MRWLLWAPLGLFLAFLVVVSTGLVHPPSHDITSKMVGRPLPPFALPPATAGHAGLARGDLAGGPRLVNFFASWCIPCAAEAPQLMALKQAGVTIEGIAVSDRPEDVAEYLSRNGDPYGRIGSDVASGVQIAMGSSGVPETFVVDAHGIIRRQHIGAIEPEDVPALIAAARATR